HLVHGAFVAVDGVHHPLEHGVEDLARLLGIAIGQKLHRALEVGEEHGDLLPFAFQRLARGEALLGEMGGRVGLGRCLAQAHAAAEAAAAEARNQGVTAILAPTDVGRADDVRAIASAAAALGTVDIVINNAAIRPRAPILEMTDDAWHRVIHVDLNAAFYTIKAFLPGMVARSWGRVVNITGMNAMAGTRDGRAHVAAAKHGLWGLTKALAREL